MNEPPKQRWGCLPWGVGALLALLVSLCDVRGTHPRIQTMGMQVKAVNNCKQLIMALKQHSKDAESYYPDSLDRRFSSANEVFRELFKKQIIDNERIVSSPESVFQPDNVIGSPPGFTRALLPGECHWMLLKHQSDAVHPKTPLVIENSLNASWPPKWGTSRPKFPQWFGDHSLKRGRSWRGREIIIGRNDGSVAVEKLRPDGTLDWHSPTNLDEHGKSWIDYLTPEQVAKLSYWDIEEK
ncbi:MAG: hypothetical protein IAE77_30375 [Prosthecobacter sp.]|uniref:hypothetical protein n=1 Tax=Prosthecobacter sp. TaxID=1965333 RepID=UPI001A06EBC5|nr:hypothetical protein [Prosthecobacter sp.]MBE2287803.1 hypothetical protein [Prosthecobacter sp.]